MMVNTNNERQTCVTNSAKMNSIEQHELDTYAGKQQSQAATDA